MYTVYKHTAPNGKTYIGITSGDPARRWRDGGKGYQTQKLFYRAITKYGWESFTHEIIAEGLTKKAAAALEIELIAQCDSTNPEKGYNNSTGGECSRAGTKASAETRHKLSEANKGKKASAETRRKLCEAAKNRPPITEETREKRSESLKGKTPYNKGQHLSEEQKRKIGEANKGKRRSPESRAKMSAARKGKPAINRKKVMCLETGAIYNSAAEAGEFIKRNSSLISLACNEKKETAGGYHWKYLQEVQA